MVAHARHSRALLAARALIVVAASLPAGAVCQRFTVYPFVGNGFPTGIASGPGQNLWVSTTFDRMLLTTFDAAVIDTIHAGSAERLLRQGEVLWGVVPSLLWKLGADHQVTTFPYRGPICDGGDGTIWLAGSTSLGGNFYGVFHLAPDGSELQRFAWPPSTPLPLGVARAADGNLWMVRPEDGIVRMSPAGVFTSYSTPTPYSYPWQICAGPDGNMWFTEYFPSAPEGWPHRSRIGRITPSGAITEFVIPSEWNGPEDLLVGPDGNIWFNEFWAKMGRITPQGEITEFPFPVAVRSYHCTIGADGAFWITTGEANLLIRMTIPGVAEPPSPIPALPAWAITAMAAALGLAGVFLARRG